MTSVDLDIIDQQYLRNVNEETTCLLEKQLITISMFIE